MTIDKGRDEFQVWDDKNVVISFNNRLWLDPQLKPISSFEKKRGSMPHRRKNIITINPSPLYQCIAFGVVVSKGNEKKKRCCRHILLSFKKSLQSLLMPLFYLLIFKIKDIIVFMVYK